MIIEHNGIEYTVSPLDGWHSRLYSSLSIDVLQILANAVGVKEDTVEELIARCPNTLLQTYEYFTKFCLSTKAGRGDFNRYNITQLNQIPAKYRKFMDLFFQEGFYDKWMKAYLHENKEDDTEADQKKEQIGD